MKRFFFKTGIFFEFVLLVGHLYILRNGLPIPIVDQESRILTFLMRTYKLPMFGVKHTLNQILLGYNYSWAALVLFSFFASILMLSIPVNLKKGKTFTGAKMLLWFVCFLVAFYNWGVPQQILLFILFVTYFISYMSEWNKPTPKVAKVCIVGGGISGLTAAYQLQKQGYDNITVFEKAEKVGGKCFSHVTDWHAFDLGGHEMLAGYSDLVQIAEEIAAPTRLSIPPLVYVPPKRAYLNFTKAATFSGKYSMFQVICAAFKYLYIVGIEFNSYAKPRTGFKNIPAELCVELDVWLKNRNLLALSDILGFVIKAQGYGGYGTSSAAYLVKFMGFQNWFSLLISGIGLSKKWPRIFVYGAQNFCERMAATVPDVRLNSTITKIERNNAEVQNGVKVFLENQSEPILFDYLIISTPLEPSGLGFLDLTSTERRLFEQIQTFDNFMTLCEVRGLPAGVVATLPLNNLEKGEYTGYIKDYTDEQVAFFLSLAKPEMTGEFIFEEIQRVLKTVVPYYGVQPEAVRKIKQKRWKYFPHVTTEALSEGFYDQLEGIQGQNQTFYASSALSFECMGNCVAYTKELVKTNFK